MGCLECNHVNVYLMVDIVSKNQSLVKSLDKLEMVWIEVLPLEKQTLGIPLAPNVFKFDFIQNVLVITFLNVSRIMIYN